MKILSSITNNKDIASKEYVDGEVSAKQDALVSGTNIKTINNTSLLGSGNISVGSGLTFDDIYPVGSIYMSINDVSPDTLFGGTWVRIQNGRFLISAGGGTNSSETLTEANSYTGRGSVTTGESGWWSAGETGGEHDHTLTVAQLPSHRHTVGTNKDIGGMTSNSVSRRQVGSSGTNRGYAFTTDSTSSNSALSFHSGTDHTGSGNSHNNVPPYLAVYMWQRTA